MPSYQNFKLFLIINNSIQSMKGQQGIVRAALHAGSWYTQNQVALAEQMKKNLANVQIKHPDVLGKVKAIIGPHAGYRFSGPVSAWSYKYLEKLKENEKLRVFLLGPSHHKYLKGISLSTCTELQTPVGNLPVDIATIEKIKSQIDSVPFSQKDEQKQHSLEMHMPFIRQVLGPVKIVPIIVGEMKEQILDRVSSVLTPYFEEQNTVFIISSDFCHWGTRFNYEPFEGQGEIWEYIKQLDHKGMKWIQNQDLKGFSRYLDETGNTICGRNPIKLFLSILNRSKLKARTQFVQYDQSSAVKAMHESSVSYAASITSIV